MVDGLFLLLVGAQCSSTKLVNAQANMASLALSLPSEDMAAIDKLDRNHRVAAPNFSPDWDQ
ncbi:hypothetical protein ABIS04_00915 [Shewanella sp. H8]|uniref:hypothetical protein n=1 Tax=Shewanella sp. H8 TaxID=3342676 RepID=UPI003314AA10